MTLKEMIERRGAIFLSEIDAAKSDTELDALQTELRKLDLLIAEEQRKAPPAPIAERTAAVTTIPAIVNSSATEQRNESTDRFDTPEYRKAFMRFCQTGESIPAEYRIDAFTAVTDAASMIPTTIMNEIIKEMKQYGQLFARVRKTSVQGGVQVPILSLKPTATRITEAASSDRKKLTANTHITFSYFGLECKVATSLLASIVTLAAFEAEIVPLIGEAMVKAQELEIIKGTGNGQMLGIAIDPRVAAGQSITLSSAEIHEWDSWKKKVFAKIPLSYRAGGLFIMGAGTFDGYIDGMVDANGQPIGRINYGITDGTQYRFGGKEVLEVEEDVVASYDTAGVGDVIAVYMRPSDYVINGNMQMAMYRWLDHDNNQWVDKAILINDGKLLDAAGVLLIKKGA